MRKHNRNSLFDQADEAWDAGKPGEAFKLFMQSASEGDSSAYLNIGFFYDTGLAVRKNEKRALYWYKKAAKHGSCSAYSNIGTIYRDKKDFKRARFWFQKALKAGDGDAALELGKLYLSQKKFSEAVRCFNTAIKSKSVTEASIEEALLLKKSIVSRIY